MSLLSSWDVEPESDLGSGRSTDFGSAGSSGYRVYNTMNYYMQVVVILIKGIDRSEIIGNVLTTMGDNHNHIER